MSEPNNSSHRVTPRRVTRSHHDRVVSGTRQKTDLQPQEILIVRSASRTKFQFVGVSSSTDEAPAVEAPAPFAVTAGARISISIPDIARRADA
jgi:hypothetical protein